MKKKNMKINKTAKKRILHDIEIEVLMNKLDMKQCIELAFNEGYKIAKEENKE